MHGVPIVDGGVHTVPHGASMSPGVGHPSILHENWDTPKTQPTPGKPVHNAQQPPRGQMTRNTRPPQPQMLRQQVVSPAQPMRYTQPQAWGRSPEQVTEDRRAATSVRRAGYAR
jgi:hypothetical protein